ncbi:unnamed protein product [Orchesella dallaii]|uniref:Mitochondrial chaperone BCS1 n=1 Tax=Orchesella dallaii TaxID=48710 RepID=A0ABP1QED2_9HEXA
MASTFPTDPIGSSESSWENPGSYTTYLTPSFFTLLCSIPILLFVQHFLWSKISSLFWDCLTISVEVSGPRLDHNHTERLYHWFLEWLAKNLKDLPHSVARADSEQDEYGKTVERVDALPGFGMVIHFQYKGQWIRMERMHTPEIRCQDLTYEKIVLRSYRHNRSLIYQLLEECKPVRKEEDEKKTIIYGVNQGCWNQIGHPKRRRPLSSVILSEDAKEKLMADTRDFKASEQWYVERGIPYRRGYLLYGPPGCGKSSFIRSIAGEIGYDICILSLTARGLTDDTLNVLMNSTPEDCIILLEDVDAAFRSREDTQASSREQNLSFEGCAPSTVTFGGLLNALDGVASTEGRLVFMTTNYVDRLDPAMVRPGRVDLKLLIDYPNDHQLGAIFSRFYPDCATDTKNEFVKRIRELAIDNISMAAVQGLFMFHKESGQEAINDIKEYFKEQILVRGPDAQKAKGLYC